MIVRKPTEAAITRCDHSYTIPPTIGGVNEPQASGHVGTESPASFEVTSAPAIKSKKVEHAVKTAYLWRPEFRLGAVSMSIEPPEGCYHPSGDPDILKVLL